LYSIQVTQLVGLGVFGLQQPGHPTIAFMGVRISWLILAIKLVLQESGPFRYFFSFCASFYLFASPAGSLIH